MRVQKVARPPPPERPAPEGRRAPQLEVSGHLADEMLDGTSMLGGLVDDQLVAWRFVLGQQLLASIFRGEFTRHENSRVQGLSL